MGTENVHKVVLINPVNESIPTTDATFAPRLTSLEGKRVGLLDNSKNNAGRMLDAIATILDTQYGFTNVVRHRKPSASKPAAPEAIEDLAKTCDLVIVGVGD